MQRRDDGQGRYGRPAYGPQQDQAWEQQPIYEARPMDQMDDPYAEYPYEEVPQEPYDDETPVEEPEVIATNGTVKLTCTLAAFCSLLALFFAFADKRSRAIHHFSVQSLGLAAVHILGAAALVFIGGLLGAIPFLGFLITILCWLLYIALLVVCVVVRVRLMLAAYAGIRSTLPLIGERLAVLFDKR